MNNRAQFQLIQIRNANLQSQQENDTTPKRFVSGEQVMKHYIPRYQKRCPRCGEILEDCTGKDGG